MTPLEYVEVLAVEQSLHDARATVKALSTTKGWQWFNKNGRATFLDDPMNFKRYLWALDDQLGFRGIDGVRLPT